ncbi:MAG: hypothetical protein AABY27_01445 [Pseudomonadota bacterium]
MKNSKKSWLIKVILICITVFVTYSYVIQFRKEQLPYSPFATSASGVILNIIEPAAIIEGSAEGDYIVAARDGSKVFAKGGLNYVVAGEGNDEFFYSLCSTKIIDGKIGVLAGFDPKNDKIKIFCAHNKINPEQIRIIHDEFDNQPITYIEVKGKHSISAIALLGDIDLTVNDLILNEMWKKD